MVPCYYSIPHAVAQTIVWLLASPRYKRNQISPWKVSGKIFPDLRNNKAMILCVVGHLN